MNKLIRYFNKHRSGLWSKEKRQTRDGGKKESGKGSRHERNHFFYCTRAFTSVNVIQQKIIYISLHCFDAWNKVACFFACAIRSVGLWGFLRTFERFTPFEVHAYCLDDFFTLQHVPLAPMFAFPDVLLRYLCHACHRIFYYIAQHLRLSKNTNSFQFLILRFKYAYTFLN